MIMMIVLLMSPLRQLVLMMVSVGNLASTAVEERLGPPCKPLILRGQGMKEVFLIGRCGQR